MSESNGVTARPDNGTKETSHDPDPFALSIKLSTQEIVRFLVEVLGRSVVMHLAKVSDPHAVAGWSDGRRKPRGDTEKRLRTAYHAFQLIATADNEYAARHWFIGLNPQLDHEAPATAIREGHLRDVLVAAQAFARTG